MFGADLIKLAPDQSVIVEVGPTGEGRRPGNCVYLVYRAACQFLPCSLSIYDLLHL